MGYYSGGGVWLEQMSQINFSRGIIYQQLNDQAQGFTAMLTHKVARLFLCREIISTEGVSIQWHY